VHDGEQGDGSRRRLIVLRRRFDRQQLAAGAAVDDVPAACAQLLSDRISGFELFRSPALDTLGQELLGLGSVQSALRAPGVR
jgi:hypothetical protein